MGSLIRVVIKKSRAFQPSQRTLELLASPVEQMWSVEETMDPIPETLGELERRALRDKHGSDEPNWERAALVWKMMQPPNAKPCWQIVQALRHTPGMGERMVKADHAALAPLLHR